MNIESVRNAMKRTGGYPCVCWWNDQSINSVVCFGVGKGWLNRISITQVHWTDAGATAARFARFIEENNLTPIQFESTSGELLGYEDCKKLAADISDSNNGPG